MISALCAALGKSPITDVLFNLTGLSSTGIYGFKREVGPTLPARRRCSGGLPMTSCRSR